MASGVGEQQIHAISGRGFFENGKCSLMTMQHATRMWMALATTLMLAGPALADTKIHAEFTADYDRIRPDPYRGIHLNNSLEVTLSGVGNVDEKTPARPGRCPTTRPD
jgi:hypothetical protein